MIPTSLDYFKATGDYASFFHKEYGDKPSKVQIVFISDKIEDSCEERWEGRDADGRLAGIGDGEKYRLWDSGKKEYVDTAKDQVKGYTEKYKLKWSVILTIRFVIPAIKGVFGLWTYSTKGDKSTIPAIRDTFDNMLEQAGTIVNIPFDLIVKKVKSQKPGSKFLFPVVSIVPNISQDNINLVREYLTSGINVQHMGLLTDDKLNSIKTLPEHEEEVDAVVVSDEESQFLEDLNICTSLEDLDILLGNYDPLPEYLLTYVTEKKAQLATGRPA